MEAWQKAKRSHGQRVGNALLQAEHDHSELNWIKGLVGGWDRREEMDALTRFPQSRNFPKFTEISSGS